MHQQLVRTGLAVGVAGLMACSQGTASHDDAAPPTESLSTDCPSQEEFGLRGFDPHSMVDLTEVAPVELDPSADAFTERHHLVGRPEDRSQRGELWLFLVGSNASPSKSSWLLQAGASLGYHVISLAYSNSPSIAQSCAGQDDDCSGAVIEEKLYGIDVSTQVQVTEANSVLRRLSVLLEALQSADPAQGWGTYLDEDGVNWSRVALGGGSQGGRVAAMLSRDVEVSRVLFASAAGSTSVEGGEVVLAPWSMEDRATPPERVWASWHREEGANRTTPVLLDFHGVQGPIVDIDGAAPPYGCSHQLRLSATPQTGSFDDAHGSMGNDELVALDDDGVPLLMPVWRTMLFTDEPN